MILLDTTVLAYSVGMDHPLREPARAILDAHRQGHLEATTTVEVLQEFLHIRSRRHGRTNAADLTLAFADAFDLISTSPAELRTAARLFVRHQALGAFDAVLAAVTIERRMDALVSADHAYAGVADLRWVDLGKSHDLLGE